MTDTASPYSEGAAAYHEPGARRVAPYPPLHTGRVGSSETRRWADQCRDWYAGWDASAEMAAQAALAE